MSYLRCRSACYPRPGFDSPPAPAHDSIEEDSEELLGEDGSSNDCRTPPGEPGLPTRLIHGMQRIPPTPAMNTNIKAIMAMHASGKIHQIIGQCTTHLLQ